MENNYKTYMTLLKQNMPIVIDWYNRKYEITYTPKGGIIMKSLKEDDKKSN